MRNAGYIVGLSSMGFVAGALRLHRPTVFCFHSVAPDRARGFRSRMAVRVSTIVSLARSLRRAGVPVLPLADALARLRDGTANQFAVLTFDDGYRDNYEVLFPAMRQEALPFTIFVTTGLVDREIPMWWDVVDRLDVTGRASARELTQRFRQTDVAGQRALVAALARRYASVPETRAYDLALTWPMLREMQASGLLTVGAHSRTHPLLARLPHDAVLAELTASRRRLEEQLDVPVRHVAFPYGQPDEVGEYGPDAARGSGYEAAFTTEARPLRADDAGRPFALPRILLSAKARHSAIAVAYMSGLPAAMKRVVRGPAERQEARA